MDGLNQGEGEHMSGKVKICCVGLCLMAASSFAQAPEAPRPPAPGGDAEKPAVLDPMSMPQDQLLSNAQAALQKGDTNAALSLLSSWQEKSLRQHAEQVGLLLSALLANGNLAEAERVYQANMAQSERLLRDYIYFLYQYYLRQGDKQARLDWIASLQARALPPDLKPMVFAWLLEASREVGPVSRVADLVPACLKDFDPATSRGMVLGVINAYDSAGNSAAVAAVLDAVEKAAGKQQDWRRMLTVQRLNLLFASGKWSDAEARFKKVGADLPDAELLGCFQYAQARAVKANQLELWDRLCSWVLKEQKAKPAVWRAAANAWLDNAMALKKVGEIPVRLEALRKMGCDPDALFGMFFDFGGLVVRDGKPDDVRALIKFSDGIDKTVSDPSDKDCYRQLIADAYFTLEDYDQALIIFEPPSTLMDAKQQAVLINKLKAHQALKKGTKEGKQDAIKRFREFMESVKGWTSPERFPYSDMIFTKEMCLGVNAKRIGDIYASLNDAAQAKAAYQEADGYYVVAEKELQAKPQESEYIKGKRDELAKLLKK